MMVNIQDNIISRWFIPLIICALSGYILLRYALELEGTGDFYVSDSYSMNDQMIVTMAELDRVVFKFTFRPQWQIIDDIYLEIKCLNSGMKYKQKFTRRTYNDRYHYHTVNFTTASYYQDNDILTYLKPGKYVASIGSDSIKQVEDIKGKLVLEYFCKLKRIWYYRFHSRIYMQCTYLKNEDGKNK